MADGGDCLSSFHPLVREWFLSRYGAPTPVQEEAWPLIASGAHVLALAPTGSGKTLAAFLGAISRLASGELPVTGLSVLYVSPLKALGEDVRRNLSAPLGELEGLFRSRGLSWPAIRAATRNGDTSQAERRRMLRQSPSILVTTPESLALMLDSTAARRMLSGVRLLVLDEIHALAGDKRGAMLACSVGRLALLAGEFQRIALSATARPVEAMAAFVGGRALVREGGGRPRYERRSVAVVDPPSRKDIELSVEWPEVPEAARAGDGWTTDSGAVARFAAIIPEIGRRKGRGSGLLVFTDSRRRAERLAFLVNEAMGEGTAWAHHGSLSKEARRLVEERFKAGQLDCVVATASLELGIDIGGVEEVLLAGTPPSIAAALQRIGRSGHGVGEASRGVLFPFHGMDLVLAAASSRGVAERAVEETRPLSCPLDVLAQLLIELSLEPSLEDRASGPASGPASGSASGSASGPALGPALGPKIDELYDIVLSFPPFERLERPLFDSTLAMLAGKYSGTRLRELEPRLAIDASTGRVAALKGARGLLWSSGGTIPDRGLFSMRLAGSGTKIGELDEEFVWERKVGEVFTLGAQAWRIVEIGSEAVVVQSAPPDPDIVPFWKGEARFRSPELCSRALALLDELGALGLEEARSALREGYGFSSEAAEACARFVAAQAAAGLGAPSLPGSRRIALEIHDEPVSGTLSGALSSALSSGRPDSSRLVLHTLRGLAIDEPLGLALAAAMEEDCGLRVQMIADDDLILVVAPRVAGFDPAASLLRALRSLARPGRLGELVRASLEGSGLFGAEFRMNAGRSLLLPRGLPGRRTPLWMTRMRARKLFEAVRGFPDFPIVVETWRSCLSDLLDLEGAAGLAREVAEGRVEVSSFASRAPSPFAREALWREIGENMYRTDQLELRASSSVSDEAVAAALRSARLRPRLDPALVADFESRLKRLEPGWGPEDALSLAEWARERVLIPASELPSILRASAAAGGRALGSGLAEALAADPSCGGRLLRLVLPGASAEILVHAETAAALKADPASHIAQWLRREAVVRPELITALFGIAGAELEGALDALAEEGTIVSDVLVAGREEEVLIDAQNLEILLRRTRAAARPRLEPKPARDLARLVFSIQGLGSGSVAGRSLARALAVLSGWASPAALWETELLPARAPDYEGGDLDAAFAASPWQWFGCGKGRISICRAEDLELFLPGRRRAAASRLAPADGGSHDFWSMRQASGLGTAELARRLWAEAWEGLVASDSFRDVRQGIANGFGSELPEPEGAPGEEPLGAVSAGPRRIPRALRERWRGGAPVGGRWYRLDLTEEEDEEPDALDEASLQAARVRALASRYGLLCRAILEREEGGLCWGELFPAMRRLELAGELLSGRFFEGLEGPQFLDPAALRDFSALGEERPDPPVWVSALDPAACALYAPAERQALLPPRLATSRVCVEGGTIIAVSTRSYRDLELVLEPGDPRLASVFGLFLAARARAAMPERRIILERISGAAAARSPFAPELREAGFETDRGRMVLW